MSTTIDLTCSCGARLHFETTSTSPGMYVRPERAAFAEAHAGCRPIPPGPCTAIAPMGFNQRNCDLLEDWWTREPIDPDDQRNCYLLAGHDGAHVNDQGTWFTPRYRVDLGGDR